VLENAKQRLRQFRSMGVDSIERLIKNVTVIQSNLELMDEEPFGYHEYLYMVHTAVDYFMIQGTRESTVQDEGLSEISCYVCDSTRKPIGNMRNDKERIIKNASCTSNASNTSNIWIGA
jgi:hypothetical protein